MINVEHLFLLIIVIPYHQENAFISGGTIEKNPITHLNKSLTTRNFKFTELRVMKMFNF